MGFDRNVFVNCPFDEEYIPLLRPLLFTILYLGLEPQIASRALNSAEPRVENIVRLIRSSRFGIHDLSRLQAKEKGEYYRLNMPFELGLDIGCQLFRGRKWAGKMCLILEAESYRYQAALSDLSNSNIAVHGNDARTLTAEVRNWLNAAAGLNAAGPEKVWSACNDFTAYNYRALKQRGYSDADIDHLPVHELVAQMKAWCATQRGRRK